MIIEKVDSGLLHSCMYVVVENDHAIVIDPCMKTDVAAGLTVDYLIVTHEHYDHISGVNEWKKTTKAPLLCSKACADNIHNPRKNMSRYFDILCQMQVWVPQEEIDFNFEEYRCEADQIFTDHMTIDWQGHKVTLIEIPGHSSGSIGIDIDETDFFSGDSLLKEYDIELRFPGGSVKDWEEIGRGRIERIRNGTKIWPGHFDSFIWHEQS